MYRLFVGLDLDKAIKDRLLSLMGGVEGARWQTREQLHLTLRFIGEVDYHQLNDISDQLSHIRFSDFPVEIKGVDFFGKSHSPRMLYAGLADNRPASELHEKINQTLRQIGIPEEDRKYVPHITLARLKHLRQAKMGRFFEAAAGLHLPPFMAGQFHLFQSHLGHQGAHYIKLESYDLAPV